MSTGTAARTGGDGPATDAVRRSDLLRRLAGYASIGAALVHAAVAPEHFSEWRLFGTFFLVLAAYQALWGVLVIEPVGRRWLDAAVVVNTATVLLWAWTRLVGLPVGPEPGEREAVGVADVLTTLMEIGLVVALVCSRRLAGRPGDRPLRHPAVAGALAAAAVGLLAAGPALLAVMSGDPPH
jgi:hypothetical protein